ncbi:MAG: HNH endonuclease signature motif containing protein [Candidatus Eremiobacteraeota bacterium]|nr:HNH endonuclease signature motif containing protein [Candidatus Eremiobacteraeota bacterium]
MDRVTTGTTSEAQPYQGVQQGRVNRQAERDSQAAAAALPPVEQPSSPQVSSLHSFFNKVLDTIDRLRHPGGLPDIQRQGEEAQSRQRNAPAQSAAAPADAEGGRAADEVTLPYGGGTVTLKGMKMIDLAYTKRPDAEHKELRKQFDGHVRKQFLRSLAADPAKEAGLRKAGLKDSDIQMLRDGKVPPGFQVHHKVPLDDMGTNDFDNLVLIHNKPEHTSITSYQNRMTAGMVDGDTKQMKWPVPLGFVYPPDTGMVSEH